MARVAKAAVRSNLVLVIGSSLLVGSPAIAHRGAACEPWRGSPPGRLGPRKTLTPSANHLHSATSRVAGADGRLAPAVPNPFDRNVGRATAERVTRPPAVPDDSRPARDGPKPHETNE